MEHKIIILGPSASGKTDLALNIAKKLNVDILSADSRQIYKHLDVSTGKVTSNKYSIKKHQEYWEIDGVKYFGFDILEPNKQFSAGEFVDFAKKIQGEYIVCGGTGLYVNALMGKPMNKAKADKSLRKELENKSVEQVLKILNNTGYNTSSLNNSEKHNKQRLIRKIEIAQQNTKQTTSTPILNDPYIVGINTGNYEQKIENWINTNFDQIKKEVTWLLKTYPNSPLLSGFIFNEFSQHVNKKLKKEETKQRVYFEYKHYIKRQLTYFKKHFPSITWYTNTTDAQKHITGLFK
jgi:tRNA dimethylallyltransferase